MKTEKKGRGLWERWPGVWYAVYADSSGKIHRERAPGGSKSAAISLYRKRRREAEMGQKLPENIRRRCVPFSEIADDWFERAKNKGKRSLQTDEGQIAVVKEWFGDRPVDSITSAEIDNKIRTGRSRRQPRNRSKKAAELPEPEGKLWSNKTRNDYRGVLFGIYKLAIQNSKCNANPVETVERYRVMNERVRDLSQEEEEILRKVIRAEYAFHEPELDFALHTGVRRENMYGLKRKYAKMEPLDWSQINIPFRVMTLQTKRTHMAQSSTPATFPLNDVALAALEVFRQRSGAKGAVIRNEDDTPCHGPKHWFEDAVKKAKIENFTWHCLRHTFATRLRRLGVPLEDIAVLLDHSIRHSGFGITARYAHVHMPNLHAAVAKLASAYPTTKPEDQDATVTPTATVTVLRKTANAGNAD